jgi:hypothetical protein
MRRPLPSVIPREKALATPLSIESVQRPSTVDVDVERTSEYIDNVSTPLPTLQMAEPPLLPVPAHDHIQEWDLANQALLDKVPWYHGESVRLPHVGI